MNTFLVALSTWLHTLATIVMIGYYAHTGLIYLPVFERKLPIDTIGDLLRKVSHQLRPYFGGSLLVFLATGTYLMLINDHYMGLGHFFSNPWSSLIVIKHFLLLPFLALAIFSDRVFLGRISDQKPEALKHFRWAVNINTALGMAILLLTSIAQAG